MVADGTSLDVTVALLTNSNTDGCDSSNVHVNDKYGKIIYSVDRIHDSRDFSLIIVLRQQTVAYFRPHPSTGLCVEI